MQGSTEEHFIVSWAPCLNILITIIIIIITIILLLLLLLLLRSAFASP